jgi:hypothetical protein
MPALYNNLYSCQQGPAADRARERYLLEAVMPGASLCAEDKRDAHASFEGKEHDPIRQFLLLTTLGNQLEVGGALPNAHPLLMREDHALKWTAFALPQVCDSQ